MREKHPLESALGHTFRDPALRTLALTHRSAGVRHNERLEFLGDSVLHWTITQWLYHHFPKATEGELTRLRATLVNEDSLYKIAQALQLSQHILVGTGEKKSGGFLRTSILADAVEALLGAIYLDSDFQTAEQCLRSWLKVPLAEASRETLTKDSKNTWQEWLQARGYPLPQYTLVQSFGPPHAPVFKVSCTVPVLMRTFLAEAPSRKIAEQKVAEQVLEVLYDTFP
jgi:ribonuclease-3